MGLATSSPACLLTSAAPGRDSSRKEPASPSLSLRGLTPSTLLRGKAPPPPPPRLLSPHPHLLAVASLEHIRS